MMVKEMSRPENILCFILHAGNTTIFNDIVFLYDRQSYMVFRNKIKFCRQNHVQARAASPPPPQHDGQCRRDGLPPM